MELLVSTRLSIYMLIFVIVFLFFFFRFLRKTRKETFRVIKPFDYKIAQDIVDAIGKDNFLDLNLVVSRLKITVYSIKLINTDLLKTTNIPTIVKGNEITLLLKQNEQEIYEYIKGALK